MESPELYANSITADKERDGQADRQEYNSILLRLRAMHSAIQTMKLFTEVLK